MMWHSMYDDVIDDEYFYYDDPNNGDMHEVSFALDVGLFCTGRRSLLYRAQVSFVQGVALFCTGRRSFLYLDLISYKQCIMHNK